VIVSGSIVFAVLFRGGTPISIISGCTASIATGLMEAFMPSLRQIGANRCGSRKRRGNYPNGNLARKNP